MLPLSPPNLKRKKNIKKLCKKDVLGKVDRWREKESEGDRERMKEKRKLNRNESKVKIYPIER